MMVLENEDANRKHRRATASMQRRGVEREPLDEESLDLVWGIAGIAKVIGRTPRQTHHMLVCGHLPPARQVCNRWVAERSALRDFFKGQAA